MPSYGSFGIANQRMWVKPSKVKGVLIGEFNVGKTSFFGSNPAALIVNCDLSSTPVPTANSPGMPAQMWPGIDPDGRPINHLGQPIRLTLDTIWELVKELVKASDANLPRPEMIVFDSATELFNILRVGTLAHFKKDTWDEGRGDAMWEWLYQQLQSLISTLRHANYGVWVIAHIAAEVVTDGDGKKKSSWAMTTPPGFFKRFYGAFEIALQMEKSYRKEVREVIREVPVNGAIVKMADKETIDVPVFTLVGENPEKAALFKRRVCFPTRINMTPPNLWEQFEQKYLEVAVPPPASPTV